MTHAIVLVVCAIALTIFCIIFASRQADKAQEKNDE